MSLPEPLDYEQDTTCLLCAAHEEHHHRRPFPFVRLLIGAVLLEIAVLLGAATARDLFDLHEAAYWQRQAAMNQFEQEACAAKHEILIKQIRHEGLYVRLGLAGQPWLR